MLVIIVLAILLVFASSYYAAYSGALRWLVFAVVLTVLGYGAVRYAGFRARDPVRLGEPGASNAGVGGRLYDLRRTLERADRGLVYSQAMFEDRMRLTFLARVRSNRHVTTSTLDAATGDPETLQEIVGDRELTEFLLRAERNVRALASGGPSISRNEFAKRAARTLDAMEAWR